MLVRFSVRKLNLPSQHILRKSLPLKAEENYIPLLQTYLIQLDLNEEIRFVLMEMYYDCRDGCVKVKGELRIAWSVEKFEVGGGGGHRAYKLPSGF